MNENEPIPVADLTVANQRKFRFKVSTKERPKQKWEFVAEGIPDLAEAIKQARQIQRFEVAVWIMTANGNYMYWTTATPGLFNSSVLDIDIGY